MGPARLPTAIAPLNNLEANFVTIKVGPLLNAVNTHQQLATFTPQLAEKN